MAFGHSRPSQSGSGLALSGLQVAGANDAFVLNPEVEFHYAGVVAQLERDKYGDVARYTTSAFM
jgi:hypothetical protein